MAPSGDHAVPGSLLVVGGVAKDGRPGGLALVEDGSAEVIDALDVASISVEDGRLERTLADGERRAIYDERGLLAIVPASGGTGVVATEAPNGSLAGGHGTSGVHLENPDGALPYVVIPSHVGDGERVELPFGRATGVAAVDQRLAEGIRVGGRVNPTRSAELRQERAFRAAGVSATSMWAAGAPLTIPDCHVEIEVENPPEMAPGARLQIPYRLTNLGAAILATTGQCPIYISARWHDPATGTEASDVVHFRGPLEQPVHPGVTHHGTMTIGAPSVGGTYHVQFTLLQENVRWFSDADDRSAAWVVIEVGDGNSAAVAASA